MRTIVCSNGKTTIVDEEDFEWLSKHNWHCRSDDRIVRTQRLEKGKWKKVRMHIEIWEKHNGEIPIGLEIDHANHDPRDNRKHNLRLATDSQQILSRPKIKGKGGRATSSQYKGVVWRADRQKWKAGIHYNGKHLSLGHYEVETDAALAYDEAIYQLYEDSKFCEYNLPHIDHSRKLFYDKEKDTRLSGKPRHSSGLRGVSWAANVGKWKAQITKNKKQHYLGLFDTPEEAHSAYLQAKAPQQEPEGES